MGKNVKLPYSSKMNKKNLESAELRKGLLLFLHPISGERTISEIICNAFPTSGDNSTV